MYPQLTPTFGLRVVANDISFFRLSLGLLPVSVKQKPSHVTFCWNSSLRGLLLYWLSSQDGWGQGMA